MFLHIWAKPPGRWQGNRSPCVGCRHRQSFQPPRSAHLLLFVIHQVEQVQGLIRHNKQGHCEAGPCQPGPCSPSSNQGPQLRQGPPNREGVCSWLMEGPLGCLWPGIRSDSAGRFCLWFLCCLHCCVVGSLETIPQSAVPSSPELLGRNGLEWPRDKKAVLVPSQSFRSWKRILGL